MHLFSKLGICGLMLACAYVAGCEDPIPPPPPSTQKADATEPAPLVRRPTTQQLTTGRTIEIPLTPVPFRLKVPESWQPQIVGSAAMIDAPTPHGGLILRATASRDLVDTPHDPGNVVESFIKAVEADARRNGENLLKFERTDHQDFILIERRIVDPVRLISITTPSGEMDSIEDRPVRWSYIALVKSGQGYRAYEVALTDLPVSVYEKDRDFIERVMSSLRYSIAAD